MASEAIKLIKVALLIHCLASLYMFSNDEILSYVTQNEYMREIEAFVQNLILEYTGYNIDAIPENYTKDYISIKSSHTLSYIAGLLGFIAILIIEEFLGIFSKIGRIIACLLCIDLSG